MRKQQEKEKMNINNKLKEKNVEMNFNIDLDGLLEYHDIDLSINHPMDLGLINETTGAWDMVKLEELFDDMIQNKITKKYGNGWMEGSKSGTQDIIFDYTVNSIMFDEDFKKSQEELV